MTYADLVVSPARTEIFLLAFGCAVLLFEVFAPRGGRAILHWLVVAGLVFAAWLAADFESAPTLALNGFLSASPLSSLMKTAALLACALALGFARGYLAARGVPRGEFAALAVFAALGICALVSAAHLLSLYLGLELMSLSLYAMIALRRDHPPAIEAALKYFVLGALASGLFLYGASMIYGATGELGFARIAAAAAGGDRALLSLGLAFALCGAAFKLGAAPFHMWLPDVYDGAPAATTAFIAAAPKIAAFAFLLRVIVEALGDLISDWRPMLIFLAVASLAVGNLAAIAQTNIKRMLAYSSISHAGFIVLGVVGAGVDGVAASLFYVIAYALMSAGGFGAVALLSQNGREADNLSDLAGLSSRAGLPAAVILALMFGMAGIPPTIGFFAKWSVLSALVDAGFVWLAAVAVAFSLIGAFYYLRVVKLMFFDSPPPAARPLVFAPGALWPLALVGFLVLWWGVFPGDLLALCEQAARVSLAG